MKLAVRSVCLWLITNSHRMHINNERRSCVLKPFKIPRYKYRKKYRPVAAATRPRSILPPPFTTYLCIHTYLPAGWWLPYNRSIPTRNSVTALQTHRLFGAISYAKALHSLRPRFLRLKSVLPRSSTVIKLSPRAFFIFAK